MTCPPQTSPRDGPARDSASRTTSRAAAHAASHCEPHLQWALDQARAAVTSPWHLAVVAGPRSGTVMALDAGAQVWLGRGPLVPDPGVSRQHLCLSVCATGATIIEVSGATAPRWWPASPTGRWLRALVGRAEVRCGQRWPPGARMRLDSTVLELRARPLRHHPYQPPQTGGALPARLLAVIGAGLALAVVGWLCLRSGWWGAARSGSPTLMPLGLLASVPLMLLTLLRALTSLRPGTARGPRRRGRSGRVSGWSGRAQRTPDPAAMLILVASGLRTGGGETGSVTQLSAWLGPRRRRSLVTVPAGTVLAVAPARARRRPAHPAPWDGPTLALWWCAQVVITGQATLRREPPEAGPGPAVPGTPTTQGLTLYPVQPASSLAAGSREASWRASRVIVQCQPHGQVTATEVVTASRVTVPVSPLWASCVTELLVGPPVQGEDAPLPERITVRELLGPRDRDVLAWRWYGGVAEHLTRPRGAHGLTPAAPAHGGQCLRATLGLASTGPVDVDLVAHGPHALVAGTTGSGKSELLTSWLLQLAATYTPSQLSYVLVDYKGGAAFGRLADLPHTAGVLTDLDPELTTRALASLEAEIARREHLLARHHVSDLSALPPEAGAARILIMVDEFAHLALHHPHVLDSLVRVASQGRSLGLHLVLATQRPHGAISPNIRANTSVRVCLRVLDEADSRDVLGRPDAAHLPMVPGRFLVAGLDTSPGTGQVLWAGDRTAVAEAVEEIRAAAMSPLAQGPHGATGALTSTTSGPRRARTSAPRGPSENSEPSAPSAPSTPSAPGEPGSPGSTHPRHREPRWDDRCHDARPWRPWAPPLPWPATFAQAHQLEVGDPLPHAAVPTAPTDHGHGHGHGATVGVLDEPHHQRLARWCHEPASQLLIVSAPTAGGTTTLVTLAQAVLSGPAPRPLHLCGLPGWVRRRWPALDGAGNGIGTVVGPDDPRRLTRLWDLAAAGALGASVLMLDDVDSLIDAVDLVRGAGAGASLLESVIRACRLHGTGLAAVVRPESANRPWAAHLATRLVLGVTDPAQGVLAGLPHGRVTGAQPGRGALVHGGRMRPCQVCVPSDTVTTTLTGPVQPTLRPLPTHLPMSPPRRRAPVWAVGGDGADALELPAGSVLVVGPAGSGRSTALRTLALAWEHRLARSPDRLTPPLVVDDLDQATAQVCAEVDSRLARNEPVLAATTTHAAATGYRGTLATLRERAALIVLWPLVGPATAVSPLRLLDAADPAWPTLPGRGVLVAAGTAVPVQIATSDCEQDDRIPAQVSSPNPCPARVSV